MNAKNIPNTDKQNITFFAKANFRNDLTPFGIKRIDRRAHIYILGKTGTGKSTLLENLMLSDLRNGYGFALLDPHGDLVNRIKDRIPDSRKADVIDFDISDSSQPFGFNPLADVPAGTRPLACSGLIQVFKHLWSDSWGPRLEYILRNCLLSLLDYPGATLSDVLRILVEKPFRREVLKHVSNKQVREFWFNEYEKYPERFKAEAISPVQNKVGAFLTHPLLRRILENPQKTLKLRKIMDEGKILLVNLSKGKIGEDTANLIGSLLVSRFDLAAISRANIPEEERKDFTLFLDEFHNFTTQSLASMLSELRKYKNSLVLSHQFLTQLSIPIRDAILGNAGTIIIFRIGAWDAELLSKEFAPEFSIADFTNLPNYHIYLKLMIDGKVSTPFSAITLPPEPEAKPEPDPTDTQANKLGDGQTDASSPAS